MLTIYLMDYFFSLLGVLLSVAFFTLMERKVMALGHYRKGPNKVSVVGVLQPLSDAEKLLTKEGFKLNSFKMLFYALGPGVSLFLMLLIWGWYCFLAGMNPTYMKIFVIISIMGLSVYGFMLMSWGSNSKYSLLGGNRVIAQILSYEVCLMMYVMFVIYLCKNFSLSVLILLQQNFWVLWVSFPIFLLWVVLCFAESNRTPFDTAEGESEIVSGFNIEYGSGTFAFIFISEYGMIMMISFLTSLMFLGGFYMMKIFLLCLLFVWVRCSFPRVRYDNLMSMSWKIFLPLGVALCLVGVCMFY